MENIETTFIANPRIQAFINDQVNTLPRYWRGLAEASLILTLGLLALLLGFVPLLKYENEQALLKENGINAFAEVTAKQYKTPLGRGNEYYIEYAFRVREKEYKRKVGVSRETYNTLRVNDELQIIYVASNPQISDILGANRKPQSTMWKIVGVLSWGILSIPPTCLGLYYLIESANDYHNIRILEASSQLVRGRITKIRGKEFKQDYIIYLSYEFLSPTTGNVLKGAGEFKRNDLRDNLPEVNTGIHILYANDRNFLPV